MKTNLITSFLLFLILAVIGVSLYLFFEFEKTTASQIKDINLNLNQLVNNTKKDLTEPKKAKHKHCFTFDASQIDSCKAGDKLIFMPTRWGNDQLPILIAGNVCDLHHSVVYNNGGLTCIVEGDFNELERDDKNIEKNSSDKNDEQHKTDKNDEMKEDKK